MSKVVSSWTPSIQSFVRPNGRDLGLWVGKHRCNLSLRPALGMQKKPKDLHLTTEQQQVLVLQQPSCKGITLHSSTQDVQEKKES